MSISRRAAAVTHAVGWLGIGFAVPVGSLVAFVVVAVAAGLLAAVAPARRAGRLDVLAASITCLRGRDDALVSLADSARWQEVTGQPLDLVEVAGGHMYLVDEPARVFEVLHSARAVAA